MSISSAFNSALSGLTAARRASDVVSGNIANALTPGYARRSLMIAPNAQTGQGVRVIGVQRHVDPGIVANRRSAEAKLGAVQISADFHTRFQSLIGEPTDPTSISGRLATFEARLVEAASRPDSAQRLEMVAMGANDLVRSIVEASEGVASLRAEADRKIGGQIDLLNSHLQAVKDLNIRITANRTSGGDLNAMLDQRQTLVDEINQIVPVRVVPRDHGQIAIYTDGGAILLDGTVAALGFQPARDVLPHMLIADGNLSGVTLSGVELRTGPSGPLGGGTLGALFQVRDQLGVQRHGDLDALARDLIERFQTPGLDPTVGAGEGGLFTEAGTRLVPPAQPGLAGRLSLNAAVDPVRGESWRLRAGLGAASPGAPGDAQQLQAFSTALTQSRASLSDSLATGQVRFSDFAAGLASGAAQRRSGADQALGYASASHSELVRVELEQGIDTDAELQSLMVIEQAYGANARVIEVVDEMMKTLLRL